MGPLLIKPAEMMLFYTGADIHKHEADNGGVLCDGVGQFPSTPYGCSAFRNLRLAIEPQISFNP